MGRSRGGFTTKLHARCDGHGRPLGFVRTRAGRTVKGFGPLFRMLDERIDALLADKGSTQITSAQSLPQPVLKRLSPPKAIAASPFRIIARIRWRNLVERLFNRLKNWRRVASRYDKTKQSYLDLVALASIKL
jgi:transposase